MTAFDDVPFYDDIDTHGLGSTVLDSFEAHLAGNTDEALDMLSDYTDNQYRQARAVCRDIENNARAIMTNQHDDIGVDDLEDSVRTLIESARLQARSFANKLSQAIDE